MKRSVISVGRSTLQKAGTTIRSLARRMIFHLRAAVGARPGLDALAKRWLLLIPLFDRHLRAAVGSERLIRAQFPTVVADADPLDAADTSRQSLRSRAHRVIYHCRAHLAAQPRVDAFAKVLLARVPLLERHLRVAVGSERGIQARIQAAQTRAGRRRARELAAEAEPKADTFQAARAAERIMADLSPRARPVYSDLLKALQDVL
jgi:hypothetical protein